MSTAKKPKYRWRTISTPSGVFVQRQDRQYPKWVEVRWESVRQPQGGFDTHYQARQWMKKRGIGGKRA